MKENYINIIAQSAKTGERKTLWYKKNCTYTIIVDCYGLGITDGFTVDRPIIYDDKRVAYSCPERLPKYIKNKFEQLARTGKICNLHDCITDNNDNAITITMPYGDVTIKTKADAISFMRHKCNNCYKNNISNLCSGAQANMCNMAIDTIIKHFNKENNNE